MPLEEDEVGESLNLPPPSPHFFLPFFLPPSLSPLLHAIPKCPHTCYSDLAHNSLGEGAGRALGKLLNGHSPQLTVLDVSDNQIGSTGGVSIGHALQDNTTLTELNLRMNRLDQSSRK